MTKLAQKEAVFQAVKNVCGEVGDDTAYTPSKEQRAQISAILFEGFRGETIVLDKEFSDADLKNYISGLQSNWLRKDTRLNGGVKYVAKNPGSRAGSSNPELKALRALLITVESDEDKAEIQGYIDNKVIEVNASKKKVKPIDFSALPAELAAKFNK